MSCTLYLLRHGIAEVGGPNASDADRSLTEDGTRKLAGVAAGLKRLGVAPDVVLSSPLRRAEQTAALVAEIIARDARVEIYPPLAPGHKPTDVLQGLGRHRRARQLMLVGHQPDLGELASFLLTGGADVTPLPFKKGGVAAIDVTALPLRDPGVLEWFLTPRQLRAIGRR
ncbi:MAG TPA: phosphohistidine phosphatase SixA [Candidatus Binatia bacterium]|nr:phosphohistidine phosphatase SixA [Candidatus Binatia bacterium]